MDEVLHRLVWLGLFDSDETLNGIQSISPLDFLTQIMIAKLAYTEGERDKVVLFHEVIAQFSHGKERWTATLVVQGDPIKYTAMAATVGYPAGIAVNLLLQDKLELTGVQIPVIPEIYDPVLQELQNLGIEVKEERVRL
mgnify:CR=1 FL=1